VSVQTETRKRRLNSRQRIVMRSLLTLILAFTMFLALERNTSMASLAVQAIGFTVVITVFDTFVLDRVDSQEPPSESNQG
jgi:hypothetical protein